MTNLFRTADGGWLTRAGIVEALRASGAADCEVLYVHSEMSFGLPNPDLGRRAILQELLDALEELAVPTIVMPSFTFSFPNGAAFDRQKSRSQMGALSEFVRTRDGSERSADPLMSVVLRGRDRALIENLPHDSLGRGSAFDRIHDRGAAARFLFFGVSCAKCFTYIHYVEKNVGVPYRYDRDFTGTIVDGGVSREETWTLYVRYAGVEPSTSDRFVGLLESEGALRTVPCGDSLISSIAEPDAYRLIARQLERDIDYFLDAPYPRDVRDTTFAASNMVAL